MRPSTLLFIALLISLAPQQPAQRLLATFHGPAAGASLGYQLAMGDVNGDGFADLVTTYTPPNATRAVAVFSGKDSRLLMSIPIATSLNDLAVADINKDGLADILLGFSQTWSGSVRYAGNVQVLSGKDGKVLYSVYGDIEERFLGGSVASAGDVNKDGFTDFVAGAVGPTKSRNGRAEVYSGKDGKLLHVLTVQGTRLGATVNGVGDIDLDGYDDVAAADYYGSTQKNNVYVFSGKDGKLLLTLPGALYGAGVLPAGDTNKDGYPDIVVSHSYAGRVYVYSGKDGKVLLTLLGKASGDGFGQDIATADVDSDGYPDIVVSAGGDDTNGADTGAVWVHSGKDGKVLCSILGLTPSQAPGYFGQYIAAGPDMNKDGVPDIAISDFFSSKTAFRAGAAWVFSGTPSPASYVNFGQGCSSQSLDPTIVAVQIPRVANDTVLQVRNLPLNQFGQFMVGFSDVSWNTTKLPLDLSFMGAPGCKLLVAPFLHVPMWTAGGTWSFKTKIPPDFSLLGGVFFNQCWVPDAKANAAGIAVSDGGKGVVGS